jgi:hypothetical protein
MITAVPGYVDATPGRLYRGLARSTPTLVPYLQPTAQVATRSLASSTVARPTLPFLGTGVGVFLVAIGGVLAGYDRLRSRRVGAAPVLDSPDEFGDVCEDEESDCNGNI